MKFIKKFLKCFVKNGKIHFKNHNLKKELNSSDGLVVRVYASRAVDLSLILSRVKPMTLKLIFTASLLDAQHSRDNVENKPASLLVPLERHLVGLPHLGVIDRWLATPKQARIAL